MNAFKLIITILVFLTCCSKQNEIAVSIKKDPIITWANPADIIVGTLLSATQLNASADVPGTFVYTPAIGTKLNLSANQDLKVDFSPTDETTYNLVSKTVKISVIQKPVDGGVTSVVFNPTKI